MEKDIVVISSDFEQTEVRIRQLVNRRLTPLESVIDIIAVKIDQDKSFPLADSESRCTILLKIKNGTTIRAESRDCDDMLAVRGALTKIVDQIQLNSLGLVLTPAVVRE